VALSVSRGLSARACRDPRRADPAPRADSAEPRAASEHLAAPCGLASRSGFVPAIARGLAQRPAPVLCAPRPRRVSAGGLCPHRLSQSGDGDSATCRREGNSRLSGAGRPQSRVALSAGWGRAVPRRCSGGQARGFVPANAPRARATAGSRARDAPATGRAARRVGTRCPFRGSGGSISCPLAADIATGRDPCPSSRTAAGSRASAPASRLGARRAGSRCPLPDVGGSIRCPLGRRHRQRVRACAPRGHAAVHARAPRALRPTR
jgi:hypothetical protein